MRLRFDRLFLPSKDEAFNRLQDRLATYFQSLVSAVNNLSFLPVKLASNGQTLTENDSVVLMNALNGNVLINLPLSAGIVGKKYDLKLISVGVGFSGTVKVSGADSADNVLGGSWVLSVAGDSLTLIATQNGWESF